MARKIHKLITSLDEKTYLLGLAVDEPDYKLCWLINNELSTDFERVDDLEIFHKKADEKQTFTIFQYFEEESLLTFRLINNRSETGYFLEEVKNLDFLIHIQGEISPDEISDFIKRISGISAVRLCIQVELDKIKNKLRLQLW